MATDAIRAANQQKAAKSLRYLILGPQNGDRQMEILKQLVETSTIPELKFLRNGILFNKDALKRDPKNMFNKLQKRLLLKGTNLPQLLVLLSNIPSAYNGHPLFNRALVSDIDDEFAFEKTNFRRRFNELQNYISFEGIEAESGRVFDEMSSTEHVYNKTDVNSNLHAVNHAYNRFTQPLNFGKKKWCVCDELCITFV